MLVFILYYKLTNLWVRSAWYYFVRTCILGWFAFLPPGSYLFRGAVKVLPAGGFILYS